MININGKEWSELKDKDVKTFIENSDESFFVEYKDDRASTTTVIEEISALSNTYGGYLLIGVSDNKEITGCTNWNEQKIHTTIHDSMSPVPIFDVRKFIINDKTIYVIRISEGPEPPYITKDGLIYERISSGTCVVKDSNKINKMYFKREDHAIKIENKISINPISVTVDNIYGYIDVGFSSVFSNVEKVRKIFEEIDLKHLVKACCKDYSGFNVMKFANSIVFNMGNIDTVGDRAMPAHTSNFIEIMNDGSTRMRILLSNNDKSDFSVNMCYSVIHLGFFRKVYEYLFKDIIEKDFVYAKKYESIKVIKQFNPLFHYETDWEHFDELEEIEEQFQKIIESHQAVCGVDTVITDNRVPKIGLYTIDKESIEKAGYKYNSESIINCLFYCSFVWLGYLDEQDDARKQTNI